MQPSLLTTDSFGSAPHSFSSGVTVGVSVIALDERGRLVLVRHRPAGAWQLPGGRLEPGESVERAAIRSVLEEAGVRIRVTYLLGIYSDPGDCVVQDLARDETDHVVNILLEGQLLHPVAPGSAAARHPGVGFFGLEHLPAPIASAALAPLQNYLHGHSGIIR
jgi:8-oxo-dGTP pyrophosphatase MutT (NUDIX family)